MVQERNLGITTDEELFMQLQLSKRICRELVG